MHANGSDMRRSRIVVLGLVLVVVPAIGSCFYFGREGPPISLTLTSPGRTYTIRVDERVDPYKTFYRIEPREFSTKVLFTAKKGDRTLAANELFWDYESSNERFSKNAYHEWVGESVLKFGLDHAKWKPVADEVTVSNDSDETIDYLLVRSSETFLVLDLLPKASVRFRAFHQTDLPRITCSGAFASGKKIIHFGRTFDLHEEKDGDHLPQRYTLNIGPEGTYINTSGPLVR